MTDRILMEDFNRDNANIESALHELDQRKYLVNVTTETDAQRIDLDVSWVDWSKYGSLYLMMDISGVGGFTVRVNKDLNSAVYTNWDIYQNKTVVGLINSTFAEGIAPAQITIPVGANPNNNITSFGTYGNSFYFGRVNSTRLRDLTSINILVFNESCTISAGTTVKLYGV